MATATQIKASESNLDQLCINSIRVLAIDAVQKANSGHPGMPMGMAPIAYLLWTRFMRHNPANPHWFGRDRFVLSAGHGSMLLYAMLYLTGYDLPLEQIKHFRQLGSITPGHPEYGLTPGVETTTGPLGQGFGNGVGMAIAAKHLRARFERDRLGALRPSHLRHLQRRRPDGGRVERSGFDRGPSRPRQHRLHLRRQPHHDRRRHRPVVRRERMRALRRLRLAYPGGRRRQRSRRGLARDRKRDRRGEPPLADSRAHRISATAVRIARTPRRRTARRSASKRSN